MNPTPRKRTFIAKHTTLSSRVRVFALPDALELEERVYSLQRRRVLFDEIQLLTLHYRRRWPLITVLLLLTVSFLPFVALFLEEGQTTAAAVCGGMSILFLLLSALYLTRPAAVLTVTSRRNQEEIQFGFRKARARQWFAQLQRSVREAQSKVAEEVANQNAAIRRLASMAGPLPMPPSAPSVATQPVAQAVAQPPAPSPAPTPPMAPQNPAPQNPPPAATPPASSTTPETPATPPIPPDPVPPRG